MNSITFYFSSGLALGLAAFAGCAALLYAAAVAPRQKRLALGCGLAWLCFVMVAMCLIAWFKGQAYGLQTAPHPVQWQMGATLAAGALLARVSLLRAGELAVAQGHDAARLGRVVRWQLVVAAGLLGGTGAIAAYL